MNKGFVVLHRKITEWEWYSDTNTFRVFLHLLLTANHKPSKFRGFEVGRGQVIIGRKALAKNLHLSEQAVRTSLEHFLHQGRAATMGGQRMSIPIACPRCGKMAVNNACFGIWCRHCKFGRA